MELLQYSPNLLVLINAIIAGLFIHQLFINNSLHKYATDKRYSRLLSMYSGAGFINTIGIAIILLYGQVVVQAIFNPIVSIGLLFQGYCWMEIMAPYQAGPERFKKVASSIVLGTVFLITIIFLSPMVIGVDFDPPVPFKQNTEQISPVLYSMAKDLFSGNFTPLGERPFGLGGHVAQMAATGEPFKRGPINTGILAVGGTLVMIVAFLSLIGIFIGKTKDKYVIFGIVSTALGLVYEALTVTKYREFYLGIGAIFYYPELSRITFLRQKRLKKEIEKSKKWALEKEAIISRAKYDSISILASLTAHEINNPLTIIKLAIRTLRKDKSKIENKKTLQIMDKADKALNRIATVTESIRALSSSSSKDLLLLDSSELDELIESFKDLAKQENIEFKVHFNQQGEIICYKHSVLKMIKALFYSTIQEMAQSHSNLIEAEINLLDKKSLEIIIKDNRPGFSEEIINNINEKRFSSEEIKHGLDLCYTTAHTITNAHKGSFQMSKVDNLNQVRIQICHIA